MKRITVYSPAELKAKYPEAFEKAHAEFAQNENDIPWTDEIVDSLKELFKACNGVSLRGYSISDDAHRSYMKLVWSHEDIKDFTGARAQAWLENNLLSDLRIPWRGDERKRLAKYGEWYRPGLIKPCPFTGVCFDEDYIESLQKDIKAGESLGDAFNNLCNVASHLIEQEYEYIASEEYFLEQDLQFTKEGKLI